MVTNNIKLLEWIPISAQLLAARHFCRLGAGMQFRAPRHCIFKYYFKIRMVWFSWAFFMGIFHGHFSPVGNSQVLTAYTPLAGGSGWL
jgi:hypothetical protein